MLTFASLTSDKGLVGLKLPIPKLLAPIFVPRDKLCNEDEAGDPNIISSHLRGTIGLETGCEVSSIKLKSSWLLSPSALTTITLDGGPTEPNFGLRCEWNVADNDCESWLTINVKSSALSIEDASLRGLIALIFCAFHCGTLPNLLTLMDCCTLPQLRSVGLLAGKKLMEVRVILVVTDYKISSEKIENLSNSDHLLRELFGSISSRTYLDDHVCHPSSYASFVFRVQWSPGHVAIAYVPLAYLQEGRVDNNQNV
uniref:Uncharacterized protein n=1 Tax=Glossina austeni TaxID=7395 RepID=A0A1A9VMF1_GLOAU